MNKIGNALATPNSAFFPVHLRYCQDDWVQLQSEDMETMLNIWILQALF